MGKSTSVAVAEVLAGEASYDSLSSEDQAVVRGEWAVRTATLLEELDLPAEFRSRGQTWVEIDDDGHLLWGS